MDVARDVLLIADDLTGACDAAVPFRLRGAEALVHLAITSDDASSTPVEAFTTDTRDLDCESSSARIRAVAALRAHPGPALLFKKIDSLLRGNPGHEILTAFQAFDCDLAVVTPAFPEMGRIVRNGHLEIAGDAAWKPLHVMSLLTAQGLVNPHHCFPSIDITCEEDLDHLVREASRSGLKILWAGSAGLASALARAFYPQHVDPQPHQGAELPVLFCIGSDHPVTLAQLETLQQQRRTVALHATFADPAGISNALKSGAHVVLVVDRMNPACLTVALLEAGKTAAGIVLSGGDTASAVCSSLSARAIRLHGEILTGIPWGAFEGGSLDGALVATKSGAFGAPDSLVRVADFFTCPRH
jgi:D-threonate/D-erythronate kinase